MIYGDLLRETILNIDESIEKIDSMFEFTDKIINFYGYLDNIINESTGLIVEKFDWKEIKTKIWEVLKSFFRKIKEAFERFLLNINYLKNAMLPKDQSDDLRYVLNLMQPRTLDGIDKLVSLFNDIISKKDDISKEFYNSDYNRGGNNNSSIKSRFMDFLAKLNGLYENRKTDLEFEFGKTLTDIEDCFSALEKSEQYKRLMDSNENTYTKEKIAIPMNDIIKDMKESNKSLSTISSQLIKVEESMSKIPEQLSSVVSSVASKVITTCKKLIEYYKKRIELLNIYFKSAKMSLKAIKNNIMNSDYTTRVTTKNPNAKVFNIHIKNKDEFDNLRRECLKLSQEKDFNGYKNKFKEICKILRVPENSTIYIQDVSLNTVRGFIIPNTYRKVEHKGKVLYHHSYGVTGITELHPCACSAYNITKMNFFNFSKNDLPDTLYPEPRVYVHISVLLDKASLEPGAQTNKVHSGYAYILKNPDTYDVYIDDEQAKTAAYIITEKDIPVEEISTDELNLRNK